MVTKTNLLFVVSTVQELKRKSAGQVICKCHNKSLRSHILSTDCSDILPKKLMSRQPISREYFTANFVTPLSICAQFSPI